MSETTRRQRTPKQSPSHVVWLNYLQRRTMRLLLQYDRQLFHGRFRTFYTQSSQPQIALLQFYDRYLRLMILSDELLDDLMPRIRRQLSSQMHQLSLQEEAPTRGIIDWPRTLSRNINEVPGASPVRFDTRLHQQSVVTPENIFAVAVLFYYRQAIQDTLREDTQIEVLNSEERQRLVSIDERVGQELADPYIRELLSEARQADMERLTEQVMAQPRSRVAPYQDLVTWWEEEQQLHIGSGQGLRHFTVTSKRQDLDEASRLYELWIALELCHFLHESPAFHVEEVEIEVDHLKCLFSWQERHFFFHYRHQGIVESELSSSWQHISAASSTFSFEREQPLTIRDGERLIWQEPPFPLRVAYASSDNWKPQHMAALTRLLGEMQLLGAHTSILLLPLLPDSPQEQRFSREIQSNPQAYVERSGMNITIREYQLTPDAKDEQIQDFLGTLLQDILQSLPERETPACHGILLDPDTINASRDRLAQGNVICPKPHIGKGVFDLVDHATHCLQDPRLCHVIGQAITPPFALDLATLDLLAQSSDHLRKQSDARLRAAEETGNEVHAEMLRNNIFINVGRAIEQYVKVRGNTSVLEAHFEEWIFGSYWKSHPRCLSEEARNMLLSAAYVWDEYKQAKLEDWAAPAVQYCRALETEMHRRLYLYQPDKNKGFRVPRGQMTLGAWETILKNKDRVLSTAKDKNDADKIKDSQWNWQLCTKIISNSQSSLPDFEVMSKRLSTENVVAHRNVVAHGGIIQQHIAQALRDSIVGHREKPGILCWIVENLQPKA